MSQHGFTETELEFLIHGFEFSYAEEWWPFLRFLATNIYMPGALVGHYEMLHFDEWSVWCEQYIDKAIRRYTSEAPFPDTPEVQEWMSRPSFVAKKVQPFVSFVGAVAKYRMLKVDENDLMEAQNAANTKALVKKIENTAASAIVASKPKPSIILTGNPNFPGSTRPLDFSRFYYHSPPPLANFLEDVRKRYELKPGDKIAMLHVATGGWGVRVMIDEEQELWDWEESMDSVVGNKGRGTVVLQVKLE